MIGQFNKLTFKDGSAPALDADNLNAIENSLKEHDDRLAALASVDNTADTAKPISAATQSALNLKADLVAGKIPVEQIPSIAMQTPFSAASESAMLALDAQTGDICIRSDTKATYILSASPASTLSNWLLMTVTADPLLPNSNQKAALVGTGATPGTSNPYVTADTLQNDYGYFHDWNSGKSYGLNEPCFYNGIPYKSLIVANINNQPDLSPTLWQVTGGASGTAGNDVYLSCTFEGGLESFAAYADAAQTSPVDGIGGSPVSTLIRNTSNALFGKADLLFSKDANNRMGEGFSKDFSLDRGATNSAAEISFPYSTSTNYQDGYVTMFVLDITNNLLINTSLPNLPATFGSVGTYVATFFPNSNSTNYRLIAHVATSTLTAWTCELDNLTIGKKGVQIGTVITPWVDYPAGSYVFPSSVTPVTFSAGKCPIGAVTTNPTKGTTSEDHAQWMRDGQDTFIKFDYKQTVAGNAGSNLYLFGIPAGQSIDLTKNPVNSYVGSGRASTAVGETDVASSPINLYVYDAVTLYAVYVSPAFATFITDKVSSTAFAMSNAVVVYRFSARFTCAQFSVNSTFVGVNEPFYLSNSETTANTNGVVSKTKLGIDGSPILANTAATYYDMTLPRALLPNETLQIQVRSKIDGNWINVEDAIVPSLYVSLSARFMNVGNFFHRGFSGIAKVSSGVVRIYIDRALSGGATAFSDTTEADRTWAQIIAAADGFDAWRVRIGQASTGAEIAPMVFAFAKLGTAFTTGTPAFIQYNNVIADTHKAITTGSVWKYTAPVSGLYEISVYQIGGGALGVSVTTYVLYKNGASQWPITSVGNEGSSTTSSGGGSTKIYLAANEYVQAYVSSTYAEGLDVNNSYMQIALIRQG